jgi:hypothetical protein
MRHNAKRLTILVLVAQLAAACGSGAPPHSDYYVITFLTGMPAPTQEGIEALDNAARAAGRHRPSFVAVNGVVPADGPEPALTKQRLAAITKAFVDDGVDQGLMRVTLGKVDAQSYAAQKDGFVIQLAYGVIP